MQTLELGPGLYRARYETGPDAYFVGLDLADAIALARALENDGRVRGKLLVLARRHHGGWFRCPAQAALSFES